MPLPDLTPLVRLLPAKVQDKAKAVAGALIVLPSVVLYLFPAVAGNHAWTIAISALTLAAGGLGVFLTPNVLPYTASHEAHGPGPAS